MVQSTLLALALTALAATAANASASANANAQAAGQLNAQNALAAPPSRSRHAGRSHRATAVPAVHKLKRRGSSKCKASSHYDNDGGSEEDEQSSSDSSSSSGSGSTVGDSQNNSTGVNNQIDWDMSSNFLKIGNIFVGMLPDDGSGGGQKESMSQLNSILPAKSAWYGRYAQVSNGKTFDGSQIYSVMDDIKESGAILAASVMPYGTWYGLTESDNRNAIAIAKVCNDIYKTHGVEVWLRFAHEMNWYQVDGTYSGGVSEFQTGWKVLSKAIEEYAPETKLWWSPNVGSDADYEKYYPKEGRVDVVGFDWYPNDASESFVAKAKPFHDKYAKGDIKMVQGETGMHRPSSDAEKMQWARSLSSKDAQEQMPNYLGWMHFNYDKFENGRQVDFKLVKPEQKSAAINQQFVSFFTGA